MGVFETSKRSASVDIAKERLKVLLVSDRVNCTPDALDKISRDLYQTISKYLDVAEQDFQVQITRKNIYITLTGEHS